MRKQLQEILTQYGLDDEILYGHGDWDEEDFIRPDDLEEWLYDLEGALRSAISHAIKIPSDFNKSGALLTDLKDPLRGPRSQVRKALRGLTDEVMPSQVLQMQFALWRIPAVDDGSSEVAGVMGEWFTHELFDLLDSIRIDADSSPAALLAHYAMFDQVDESVKRLYGPGEAFAGTEDLESFYSIDDIDLVKADETDYGMDTPLSVWDGFPPDHGATSGRGWEILAPTGLVLEGFDFIRDTEFTIRDRAKIMFG